MTSQQAKSIEAERIEGFIEFLSRFLQRFLVDITDPKIVPLYEQPGIKYRN
jgi:hypothetical protein